jgi:hypothetical protein
LERHLVQFDPILPFLILFQLKEYLNYQNI